MIKSSNQLRESLAAAACTISEGGNCDGGYLKDVRTLLGLAANGSAAENKTLLSRQVVAKVLHTIDAMRNDHIDDPRNRESVFAEAKSGAASSKGVTTTFAAQFTAQIRTSVGELFKAGAKVTLNQDEQKCLVSCLERDMQRRRAGGLPTPSFDDIIARLKDRSHPALTATLLRFKRDSSAFLDDPGINTPIRKMQRANVFLSGAPKGQVEDRLDLMTLLLDADASDKDLDWRAGNTMALVSEKLPMMRRLQPKGPLTLDTVWKACFGKSVPQGLAKAPAADIARALDVELKQFAEGQLAKIKKDIDPGFKGISGDDALGLTAPGLAIGMSLSFAIRNGVRDKRFNDRLSFDPSKDLVANESLYNVENALANSEEAILQQLCGDLRRQDLNVTIEREGGASTRKDDPSKTISIKGWTEDGRNKTEEEVRPDASKLMEAVDKLVGTSSDRVAQGKVLKLACCQAGLLILRTFGIGEHADANIHIVQRSDGSVRIDFSTMDGAPVKVAYGYDVQTDGSNIRTGSLVVEPQRK